MRGLALTCLHHQLLLQNARPPAPFRLQHRLLLYLLGHTLLLQPQVRVELLLVALQGSVRAVRQLEALDLVRMPRSKGVRRIRRDADMAPAAAAPQPRGAAPHPGPGALTAGRDDGDALGTCLLRLLNLGVPGVGVARLLLLGDADDGAGRHAVASLALHQKIHGVGGVREKHRAGGVVVLVAVRGEHSQLRRGHVVPQHLHLRQHLHAVQQHRLPHLAQLLAEAGVLRDVEGDQLGARVGFHRIGPDQAVEGCNLPKRGPGPDVPQHFGLGVARVPALAVPGRSVLVPAQDDELAREHDVELVSGVALAKHKVVALEHLHRRALGQLLLNVLRARSKEFANRLQHADNLLNCFLVTVLRLCYK
mmetsp:Transcript_10324/g.19567  ORF Transcript_10324/g.19567 Transcript_10324/m.19567 type:complete len:364 (+) Transcript_10324:1168-2259(+)